MLGKDVGFHDGRGEFRVKLNSPTVVFYYKGMVRLKEVKCQNLRAFRKAQNRLFVVCINHEVLGKIVKQGVMVR